MGLPLPGSTEALYVIASANNLQLWWRGPMANSYWPECLLTRLTRRADVITESMCRRCGAVLAYYVGASAHLLTQF